MNLPTTVKSVLEVLNKNGYEAFIVGGCVRDSIMGKHPHDFDITTDALPEQVKSIFRKTYDTGIQHGTITVVWQNNSFEVTTYRIDGEYKDNRHPEEVIFTKKIEEDLSRRDFTVNAIAYNPEVGFIDCFHGKEDIENKLIRGVGKASERFQEDALRMLRAIRFSAQLDFDIEISTWNDLKDNVSLIKNISVERIHAEMSKMLVTQYVDRLPLIWKSGLLGEILPSSIDYIKKYESSLLAPVFFCKSDIVLRLALLFRYADKVEVENILKTLKFDNKTVKSVATLVGGYTCATDLLNTPNDAYKVRKAMCEFGADIFESILYIKKCILLSEGEELDSIDALYTIKDKTIESGYCISLKQLKISGNDLKQLGIQNGKQIGDTLQRLLDIVLRDPEKNTFEILKSNLD